ncbi:MAG TPA: 5-formyltetrahydrofolate cyclo-ligase [Acidimicrobiales bacterium]|nr:5-formyltetrahydrofolate cyclo-ligase [Acidimicrobiales bacterium]
MARAAPRHDRDAGGDPQLLAAKARLRQEVWSGLRAAGVARFPGAEGRIPNFVGAEAAAERLRRTDVWTSAETVKSNPDAPQWPVRQRVLEDGKTLFMAVPRLADPRPFFRLDPERLRTTPRKASSIKGASTAGRKVDLDELEPVDLVVTGCVAVGEDGARLGKGGGFSDLELALAAAAGLVGRETVVVTTVHDLQVRPAGTVPRADHDVGVDVVVTPTRVIRPRRRGRRVAPRLRWEELTEEKVAAIPLLASLRRAEGRR